MSNQYSTISHPEEEREATKLDFLVEVAHDLRSPLTSILFLSEVLQKGQSGEVNESQRRQLGIIYSAAFGLISVTSDLIEYARGGYQLYSRDPEPFSVRKILSSVNDIVSPLSEEKGLTMKILPPEEDLRRGYPIALSRALLNLTTNALKYTEEGFVEIIATESGDSEIEFSVRDTGPGIDPELLDTLYQPLRPSPTDGEPTFSGTGLGLFITRRLVEAMGSELLLETQPGQGTRFSFTLKLEPIVRPLL